jgi:membrane fusion protein (multidrug efflux system)
MHRVVPALVLLASCTSDPAKDAPKKRPPPLVTVSSPTVRDVPITLQYTVDIRPIEQADLQSKVAGYVEKIQVDRGDAVKKGQLLAEVRPSDLPQQVGQAKEQVSQAQAGWQLADENVKRARELFKREMISKAELDQAEAQLRIAQASHAAARSGQGVVETRLSETRLYAPFAGFVAKRYLDPGALVQPGPQNATILTVMRIDQVRVFVSVLESQAPLVRVGQPADVTLDALPGKRYAGKVTRVPPALDMNTRTLEVEIVIPNPDGVLKPGMYGRATLTVDTHPHAVVLPVEAVITEENEHAVYVVEDIKPAADGPSASSGRPGVGRARRVQVQTGFDGGDWLEIAGGLKGDEKVIILGVDLAGNGQPVSVKENVAHTASAP